MNASLHAVERQKYETMWGHDDYRAFSPGLHALEHLDLVGCLRKLGVHTILDAGCGSGKVMRRILELHSDTFTIRGFDIAKNCLDPWFAGREDELLTIGCLWAPGALPAPNDAVICTDVMEHIPTEQVPAVLGNLRSAASKAVFLGIALFPDAFGPKVLGSPLHLTVQPVAWWQERIAVAGLTLISSSVLKGEDGSPMWLYVFARPSHPSSATTTSPQETALQQTLNRVRAALQSAPHDGNLLDKAAVLLYRAGQSATAVSYARQAVAACPRDPFIHDHLSLILLAAGHPAEAVTAARRATALAPRQAPFWLNLGNALLAQGEPSAAVAALTKATSLDPREPRGWFNLGNALAQSGDCPAAIDKLRRALALDANFTAARDNLSVLLHQQHRYAEVVTLLAPVIGRSPEVAHRLGSALLAQEEFTAALVPLENAVRLAPTDAAVHLDLARCLRRLDRPADSQQAARTAAHLAPGRAAIWHECALSAPEPAEAERCYRQALMLDPSHWESEVNLAGLLLVSGRAAEAVSRLEVAVSAILGQAELFYALGTALQAAGRITPSVDALERAVALAPGHIDARWNLALCRLRLGRYAEAWPDYELRWQTDWKGTSRYASLPRWPFQTPRNGHLLIWGEQGIGDEIMFGSLLPWLSPRVDRLTVACTPRLAPLFARSLPGVTVLAQPISRTEPELTTGADWQLPAGSILGHYTPADQPPHKGSPWLVADPSLVAALRTRYQHRSLPVVGLSWKTTNPRTGSTRSIAASEWIAALATLDARFVSLQYGDCAAELAQATAAGLDILADLAIDPLQDLDGFAAQVSAMDAIITIDNSTAHFAGALGRHAWILLPTPCDWRWGETGEASVWYRTLHLQRRAPGENWACALKRTTLELTEFLPSSSAPLQSPYAATTAQP